MTKEQTNSWIEEFDKDFTLEENGCSDCITESLFYKGKTCYDLNELKSFISKNISREKDRIKKELHYIGVSKQEFNESTEHWKGRRQGFDDAKYCAIKLLK